VYAKILAGQTSPPGSYTDTYSTAAQAQVAGNVATTLPGTCGGGAQALSVSVTATVRLKLRAQRRQPEFWFDEHAGVERRHHRVDHDHMLQHHPLYYRTERRTGTGATVAARKMTKGAATIVYSLYKDSARSSVWGNTVGTNTAAGTGTGSAQTSTVFGRVPPQSVPAPGTYNDTIVVTATF